MKQSHWLLCAAKNCDWSSKITPLSNLTRASLLVEWQLTAKAELNRETSLQILKKMLAKFQVSFCHQSSPVNRKAWTLPWILQELKKYPRKTCGCGQPRGHLIRVLNESRVTTEIFVFCGLRFSNQFDSVPWNGLREHSHRRARLCFYFNWF